MNNSDFFNVSEVEISLTYPFLNQSEPMRFFLRPILVKEEKEARQIFYALSDDEQETQQHEYNLKLLGSLSVRLPENVPTFDERFETTSGEHPTLSIKRKIESFFDGSNPMKRKIVEDVINLYFQKTQPREFFR
jgi:hypothetical protein